MAGHPLLAYSIAAAKLAGIDQIWVSTDSEEYAAIAQRYGAEVPFLRPAELSGDHSTDFEFMRHAMEWMIRQKTEPPEFWIHLRPTTPIREPAVLLQALEFIGGHPKASSLRSGHEAKESPFKWFLRDEQGYFKGLRNDLTPEKVNLPRQQFPKAYNPNGYVDIVKASHVLNHSTLHGDRMLVFESPRCPEIDNPDDFEFLEYQIQRQGTLISKYLNSFK